MKTVTPESVLHAAGEFTADLSIAKIFDDLDARQPNLPGFSMRSMADFPSELGMQVLMIAWYVLRAFEHESEGQLPIVTAEQLIDFSNRNRALSINTEGLSIPQFMEIMSLETSGQPFLMEGMRKMISGALLKEPVDSQKINAAVQGYLTIKSIVDAIDSATN